MMKIFIPLILFFILKNETNFASPINSIKNEFNNMNSAFLQVPNSSANEFKLIPSAQSAFSMKISLRTVRVDTFGEDENDVPEIIHRLQEIANHSATKEEKQKDEDLSSLVNTTIGLGPCFFGRCDVRVGTIGVGTPSK